MPSKATGVCVVKIEANAKTDKKIKISPAGEFKGFDERVFTLSEQSVAATLQNGIDLPVNVEHGMTTKYHTEAVGWIALDSLELKEDGLYGQIEWNDTGKALIKNRSYRYLSPEFIVNQNREVITIEAVALTNRPNLDLEVNEEKEQNMKQNELQERLDALKEENAKKDETIASLTAKLKEQAFNAALTAGKVTPAQKEFAMGLELNQLESWLATQPVAPHASGVETGEEGEVAELNEFEKQINW